MNKIGVLILTLGLFQAYFLTHVFQVVKPEIVNYMTIFSYCLGLSLISMYEFKKESNKWTKYLFWNVFTILEGVIVLTYIVDLIIDDLIGTSKILLSAIITSFISLCVYLFKQN